MVKRKGCCMSLAAMFLFVLMVSNALALTPTIHSVASGGVWNNVDTWVEGRVPTEADVVEINGSVSLNTNATVEGVVVFAVATFVSNGIQTLTINGDAVNNGTITNSSWTFYIKVSGSITNNGIWNNSLTTLTGTQTRKVYERK